MRIQSIKWRVLGKARRVRRAWRYFAGTLTKDEASAIRYELRSITGYYTLMSISAEDVLQRFEDEYEDHPELERLCDQAACRVADKWGGNDEVFSSAVDWAADLVLEYAKEDGIELVPIDAAEGTA